LFKTECAVRQSITRIANDLIFTCFNRHAKSQKILGWKAGATFQGVAENHPDSDWQNSHFWSTARSTTNLRNSRRN